MYSKTQTSTKLSLLNVGVKMELRINCIILWHSSFKQSSKPQFNYIGTDCWAIQIKTGLCKCDRKRSKMEN